MAAIILLNLLALFRFVVAAAESFGVPALLLLPLVAVSERGSSSLFLLKLSTTVTTVL